MLEFFRKITYQLIVIFNSFYMKMIVIFNFLLMILFLPGCVEIVINDDNDFSIPQNEADCIEAGGRWGNIGLATYESCNLPTSDGGKICSDRSECESECIAELTSEQKEMVQNDDYIETTGKCYEYQTVVGCRAFVEDGKVTYIICID